MANDIQETVNTLKDKGFTQEQVSAKFDELGFSDSATNANFKQELMQSFSETPVEDFSEEVVPAGTPEPIAKENAASVALDRAITNGTDLTSEYAPIVEQYQMSGQSSIVDNHVEQLAAQDAAETEQVVKEMVLNGTITDQEQLQVALDTPPDTDVTDSAATKANSLEQPDTVDAERVVDFLSGGAKSYKSSREFTQEAVERMLEEEGKGVAGTAFDIVSMLARSLPTVPFGVEHTMKKVAQEMGMDGGSVFRQGETTRYLQELVKQTKGPAKVQLAHQIMDLLREHSGFLGRNRAIEFIAAQDIFVRELAESRTEAEQDLVIANTFTDVGDVLAMTLVPTGIAGDLATSTKLFGKLAKIAPSTQSKIAKAALEDADSTIANSLNMTKAQVADKTVIPKPEGAELTNIGADVSDEFVGPHLPRSISLNEKADESARVQRVMDKVDGAALRPQNSRSYTENGQLVVEGVYGADKKVGFPTFDKAMAKAKQVFGDENVTIFIKAGDRLVEATSGIKRQLVEASKAIPYRGLSKTDLQNVQKTAISKVKSALSEVANTKLSRAEFKSLQSQKKALIRQLDEQEEALRAVSGKRKPSQKQIARLRAPLEAAIDSVQRKLDIDNKAHGMAKSISRVEQFEAGKGELTGELKKLYDNTLAQETAQAEANALRAHREVAGNTVEVMESVEGEYFFSVKKAYVQPAETKAANKVMFGPDTVQVSTGKMGDYFFDPASRFITWLVKGGSRVIDAASAQRASLFKVIEKPFAKLNKEKQRKIMNVIETGSKEEKAYDQATLKGRFELTDQEVHGYNAVRKLFDNIYDIANRMRKDDYTAKGYNMIKVGDDDSMVTYGRVLPVDEHGPTPKVVYDYATKSVTRVNPQDILKEGKQLVKLHRVEFDGKTGTSFGVIDPKVNRVSPLPEKVLPYREGYVTRYYTDDYFVVHKYKAKVDGKDVIKQRALYTAGDKPTAMRMAKEAREQTPDIDGDIIPRHSRELHADDLELFNNDLNFGSSGAVFGRRGKHLQGLDGAADIADPAEGVMRAISTVSNRSTIGEWVTEQRQRWMNTYGDLLPEGQIEFPRKVTDIADDNLENAKRVKDARSLFRYINQVQNSRDDADTMWRSFGMSTAEWIEGAGDSYYRNLAAHGVKKLSTHNPLKVLNSISFTMYLALNPFRQLLLQGQQILFLTALDPKAFAKAPGKWNALRLANRAKGREGYDATMNALAKQQKMSRKDFDEMVEQYQKASFGDAVDAHSFVSDDMKNLSKHITAIKPVTGEGATARAIRETASNTLNYLGGKLQNVRQGAQSVGFDAGEKFNLEFTWAIAHSRHMEKMAKEGRKVMTQADWDDIAGETRQLSLTMNRAGELGYQRGWLKSLTQFLSVQHKAIMVGMRGVPGLSGLGNKAFTPAEARRILLGQTLFWGTTGTGMTGVYHHLQEQFGWSTSPEVEQLVTGGLVETMVNEMLDANLDIGSGFAPMGGMYDTVGNAAMTVLTGDKPIWEIMPSASAVNKIGEAVTIAADILNTRPITDPETAIRVFNNFASLSSGYNNALKGSAYNTFGKIVNALGDPLVDATFNDMVARGVFGIPNKAEREYRELTEMVYGKSKPRFTEHQEIARQYHASLKRQISLLSGDSPDTLDERHLQMFHEAAIKERAILEALEPADAQLVIREFQSLLVNETGQDKFGTLVDSIVRMALNNDFGSKAPPSLQKLMRSTAISDEDKKAIMQAYEFITDDVKNLKEE